MGLLNEVFDLEIENEGHKTAASFVTLNHSWSHATFEFLSVSSTEARSSRDHFFCLSFYVYLCTMYSFHQRLYKTTGMLLLTKAKHP